jgi:predicted permease
LKPPRIARWLLRVTTAPADRPFLLADAEEEFTSMLQQDGQKAARAWYWRQALASAGPQVRERARATAARIRHARPSPRGAIADFGQGIRWVRRHPSTAGTVVLTLAIASGAALAAFAIVESVVLRPLPFPSAGRIVSIRVTGPTLPPAVWSSSLLNFRDWRARARAFAVMSAYTEVPMRLTGLGEPRQIEGIRVAEDFEAVFGLQPALGRFFAAGEFVEGAHRSVVLSHGFWTRQFGADPAVVGRTLTLDEQAFEIVGVLPATGVAYPAAAPDLWVPLVARKGVFWENARNTGWLQVIGRVRDDSSVAAASAELSSIAAAMALENPASDRERTSAELRPISEELVGAVAPVLLLVGLAVAAVLLIACANIANLLLASASSRGREFAVRAALGAGRTRLARQVLGESLLLCGVGTAAGLGIAPILVRAFLAIHPSPLPRAVDAAFNPLMWAAAASIAIAAATFLSVPQVLQARRGDLRSGRAGSSRSTATRVDRAFRAALVTVQIGLSFVLVVAGVGFLRTLGHLQAVDTGFRPDGVMTFTVTPAPSRFGSGAASLRFYESVVDEIKRIPGVRGAAAAVGVPMTIGGWRFGITPPGATAATLVTVNLATGGYFETLGIQLREGRLLTDAEQRSAQAVVVVNEPLGRILGNGESAVGRRLQYSGRSWEVVGVVQGARTRRPRDEPMPEVFLPWHMAGARPQAIVVRTTGDPLQLLAAITTRVQAIDPSAPLADVARLDDRLRESVAGERFRASLVASLAGVALALAALGAYSVTAYTVARRRREYGIRLALGERPWSIWRRAVFSTVAPACAGCAAGAALSLAAARWIEAFLYGVSARDGVTFAVAAILLLTIAVAAGSRSARRASTLRPAEALANE